MKTIVVPLDLTPESERAVAVAVPLARRWKADLVFATATTVPDPAGLDLDDLRRRSGADTARVEVVYGDDVEATIADLVDAAPDPVICMASHGRSSYSRAIVGSVTEHLLERVHCPMLLVGPHSEPALLTQTHRLLTCLDQSASSEAILEPSTAWARELGLELWLAEVFHPRDVDSREAPYRFLDTIVARLRPEFPDVRACVSWNTETALEIVHLARSLSVSLISVGTHGLDGLERFAFGSVAMGVVHSAPCPVLVIGPAARAGRPDMAAGA